jgi:hypothetical protein
MELASVDGADGMRYQRDLWKTICLLASLLEIRGMKWVQMEALSGPPSKVSFSNRMIVAG